MDEKIFYENDNVKVTSARFIVNNETYALSSINSVKVSVVDVTFSYAFPSLAIVVGLGWLFFLIVLEGTIPIFYIQSVALVVASVYALIRFKKKLECRIVLTTSPGDCAALKSNERQDIALVERALNDAIVYRG